MTGIVFNIQRYSTHDGPGIRTTVFFKGCPLSCLWCHNPEGRASKREVAINADRCIRCGACLEVCTHDAARFADTDGGFDPLRCTRCGVCTPACPSGAREIVGWRTTVENLMLEIERDRVFYEQSGGGVTFSGGEPLAQLGFLRGCLERCRRRGHHTAVDTSGHAPRRTIMRAAELTDLFLYDLKLMDAKRHRAVVGVGNRAILENLEALADIGAEVWIRVPLIPGINDDVENLEATAAFVTSLARPYPLQLIPYHRIGGDKYRRLGQTYGLLDLRPPSTDRTARIADQLRGLGVDVSVGG